MSYETQDQDPSDNYRATAASTATAPRPPTPNPASTGGAAKSGQAGRIVVGLTVAVAAVVGAVLFVMMLAIAIFIGVIAGVAIEGDTEEISHTPVAVEDVPTSIEAEQADVVIDLSSLTADDFAGRTEPLPIDVDVEFGAVRVIVPEGLTVAVDADTDVGSTTVFDQTEDGFDNRVVIDGGTDADLNLTIDVDAGDIDVEWN